MEPSRLVSGWLRLVDGAAAPLVRLGVPADAVTVAGAALAGLAVPAALADEAVLAGAAVLASGLLDGLDGAVARGSGSSTAHGVWLDRAADRAGEVAAAVALVLLGAPWWLALAALLLGAAMEAVRASDRRRGCDPRPPTVGERPTRVVVAGMFAVAAGVTSGWSPSWSPSWSQLPWAGLGAGAWATACAVGAVQLALAGRRRDATPRGGRRSGGADEPGDDLG
jgi:phosphatidylglycerophosphate synthase